MSMKKTLYRTCIPMIMQRSPKVGDANSNSRKGPNSQWEPPYPQVEDNPRLTTCYSKKMTYLGCQKALQTVVNADEVLPSPTEQLHDLKVELHSELIGLHSVLHLVVPPHLRVIWDITRNGKLCLHVLQETICMVISTLQQEE